MLRRQNANNLDLASSDLFVTLNTHQPPSDELKERLRVAIVRLGMLPVAATVFTTIELRSVTLRAEEIGFELTSKRGIKLHTHFVIEITHSESTPLSLGPRLDAEGKGVNRRLQDYFNEELSFDKSCYVEAQLMRDQSATKNYNRKQQRQLLEAAAEEREWQSIDLEERDTGLGRLYEDFVVIDRREDETF
jgi:hypothetical protein